jgi:ribosomal protein L12E/L44/L45/RPP1/RPP2
LRTAHSLFQAPEAAVSLKSAEAAAAQKPAAAAAVSPTAKPTVAPAAAPAKSKAEEEREAEETKRRVMELINGFDKQLSEVPWSRISQ